MEIIFKVDADRMTLDDLIVLESRDKSNRDVRDLLARFLVNGKDEYMPDDEARQAIGKLSLNELELVMDQFLEKVKGMRESAVPPEISGE